MNYKKVVDELIAKKFADSKDLIAWGKLGSKKDFTTAGVEGANSWRYAITKAGDDLLFIPFSRSGVYFKNMYAVNKSKIAGLKLVGSKFRKYLEMHTVDGYMKKYRIIKNTSNLTNIIKMFGL